MSEKIQVGDAFPFHEERAGEMDWCNVCGRKLGKNPFWVEVINGGEVWDSRNGDADTSHAGYMGNYPVGMECAKKFADGIAVKVSKQ